MFHSFISSYCNVQACHFLCNQFPRFRVQTSRHRNINYNILHIVGPVLVPLYCFVDTEHYPKPLSRTQLLNTNSNYAYISPLERFSLDRRLLVDLYLNSIIPHRYYYLQVLHYTYTHTQPTISKSYPAVLFIIK